MNKEIISAMLSADTPAPINGMARGGTPQFTKQDAMGTVAGMPTDAWNYTQYVDILADDKMAAVSQLCSEHVTGKDRAKIEKLCDIALLEKRYGNYPKIAIRGLIGVSKTSWYNKYSLYYSMAVTYYNNLDNKATRHINIKLGRFIDR